MKYNEYFTCGLISDINYIDILGVYLSPFADKTRIFIYNFDNLYECIRYYSDVDISVRKGYEYVHDLSLITTLYVMCNGYAMIGIDNNNQFNIKCFG